MEGWAIIGDLVGSRDIESRTDVAVRVEGALAQVNAAYRSEWYARVITTRGIDELSGVLRRATHAFDIAVALNEAMWPARFRLSLAVGSIDIGAETADAGAMDGPVFHAAADGLARARRQQLAMAFNVRGNAIISSMAEHLANLHAVIVQSWTPAQAVAVRLYRGLGNQELVAKELDITQQAVSDHLQRARFEQLSGAEHALLFWLQFSAVQESTRGEA